ncbi:[histone H3]-trimethyl-L-lysine4 demethylase [Geosmithia morbida]|uniref:[histone H3]-trimethyl-L-lysine4 demethylase n=1 Tax=Geosmithia morbida TaxID=1094350 RepID=A0A9P4YQ65_9HYPO|nr:[histone H3]-trimethyl-L-lysine4 demethylase [Geosmithia morbida]KAF4120720.1 [histone H3]-trimethyl-L-lysine4 demethylase [Geosmithia morbida]
MGSTPIAGATASAAPNANSRNASARSSPAVGGPGANGSLPKDKINSNGYHPANPHKPLSTLVSPPLDMSTVERRGQPSAVPEPTKPRIRPLGIEEAPTYFPTEAEFRDPLEYIKKISPEASRYGICKVVPPDSWNPTFPIDTEKFHFRTRKQELNSVEGSTRANLTYLDGLTKYHKQQGSNLHRLPYVDKKPLDLYRLKKAVESRGGFDKVCKLKKWAEIGRDLGYSGKIMSSLSTSLKNSYQRWLCPYEDYLRAAKPGVHQQLEAEYGGPLTPSPAVTPVKRSTVNTPMGTGGNSPTQQTSDVLQTGLNGIKDEAHDTPMPDARPSPVARVPLPGFATVNSGFTSVNRPANRDSLGLTPEPARNGTPAASARNTPEARPSALGSAAVLKRQQSCDSLSESAKKDAEADSAEGSNRRSKRLKREVAPTVAGSYMSQFRPSVPRVPREEDIPVGEKCATCGKGDSGEQLIECESCDNSYHLQCLDPPPKRKPDAEWNCPRCLVGDGYFGFEEGGLYSLKQFQQKANDFKQGYFEAKMPSDQKGDGHRPVTEEDVENEFWRLVTDLEETIEVEYGADIHCTTHGSGFPTLERQPSDPYSSDLWNLNVLPFHPDSLFRHIKSDISGMTVPWVYVGMIFSTFCWHNEDHLAYSANYQHFGATKTWYGIPGEDTEKFEAAMRETVPELFETQPDLLFQLVTLLTPEQLRKAGVRVYAVDQRAGQFVLTFPKAYHAGFNHGFNFNEAVNFAPSDWEPFGYEGVERLQMFRRQPCFSHDELLWTAAEGSSQGLTIQTAKWLAPALDRVRKRESSQRRDFIDKHLESNPHRCRTFGRGDDACPLTFETIDEDVADENEQCCAYCKAFAYLSRFKCLKSGKVLCIAHAGHHACCDRPESERLLGLDHVLIYRKTDEMLTEAHTKVTEKAHIPDLWEKKYQKLLEEEPRPSLKSLRALLHEGERISHDLDAIPVVKEFVDRCNDWVEEATTYLIRKQQNRRKNERVWQNGSRRSIGSAPAPASSTSMAQQDQPLPPPPPPHQLKEKESRNVSNIHRLLQEAEHIGFDCPEIHQLRDRAEAIESFRETASRFLANKAAIAMEPCLELLEEGRSFNVGIPELDGLSRVLEQMQWDDKARSSRKMLLSLSEVQSLIEEGRRLEIPAYNDHLQFWSEQLRAGEEWEKKVKELIQAEFVHIGQLEALSGQVQARALPVSGETQRAVDGILHKQREAHRLVQDMAARCASSDFRERPKYAEAVEMMRNFDDLHAKPNGAIDMENERKRHEDWMRKGKKLFGKSNAPLHILKSHLEHVLERNRDCFDTVYDTPRMPGEPVSREASPEGGAVGAAGAEAVAKADAEAGASRPEEGSGRPRQVFCICRKMEAGMMIECELCHEWYHYKCLKIARGKVKEDEKYTCPICDWRMKIPRDASRPKLEDLVALVDEIQTLPFQPEEEEVLRQIIDNAQGFREHIARFCNPIVSTEAELSTQRFYLRKLEGAEVLLAYETNFFRQELHKLCPVAPEAPPILEVSLSTRKPRPTKLQKMLAEYGVDNPDDLPEHAKGKANSLRRKAANAEAAAAAAAAAQASSLSGGTRPPTSSHSAYQPLYSGSSLPPGRSGRSTSLSEDDRLHSDPMDLDGTSSVLNGAQLLEDRVLRGEVDDAELNKEEGKRKALEMLSHPEQGRRQVQRIWGADVLGRQQQSRRSTSSAAPAEPAAAPVAEGNGDDEGTSAKGGDVDQMPKGVANQDDVDKVTKEEAVPSKGDGSD